MDNEINFYGQAGEMVATGNQGVQVGYWMAAILGLSDGTVTFDGSAAGGKGQFKGASKVIKACDAAGYAMPQEYKGLLSKALKVLSHDDVRLYWVGGAGEDALVSASVVFKAFGGVSAAYAALFPGEEKGESNWNLIQAVAALLATARKREIGAESVLEEVMAQVESELGEGGASDAE